MRHTDIRRKLSAYIDGSVSVREKAQIESHLESCATCRDACQELRMTIAFIKNVERMQPSARMTQEMRTTVHWATASNKDAIHRFFIPLQIKIPIVALALILLAVAAFYLFNGRKPSSRFNESMPERYSFGQHASVPPAEGPSHPSGQVPGEPRKEDSSTFHGQQVPQSSAYKSLDMKLEYASPEPPVRKNAGKTPSIRQNQTETTAHDGR